MREARCDASASSALEHGSGAFCVWTTTGTWKKPSRWPSGAEAARIPTRWSAPCSCATARSWAGAGISAPESRTPRLMALAEAGERAAGATLYCTLEPCSHQGQTPPCADALVAAGIRRAVVALGDPNPLVDGRGLARLREGSVEVELQDERWGARARKQNAPFLKYHASGLPLVTYKAADDAGRQGGGGRRRRPLDQLSGQPPRRAPAARHGRRGDGRRGHVASRRP